MINGIILLVLLIVFYCSNCFAECSISVSGFIQNYKDISYKPENLNDSNIQTAWCVNTDNASPVISINNVINSIHKIVVINGYAKTDKAYSDNARAKDVIVETDTSRNQIYLQDTPYFQFVNIDKTKHVKLTILSYYPGAKYKDLCLSEIIIGDDEVRAVESYLNILLKEEALTKDEIKSQIGAIYKTYKKYIKKLISMTPINNNEKLLRLLLNFAYYEEKYALASDAEYQEYLVDTIGKYFYKNTASVLKVLKDNSQINRRLIIEVYELYSMRFDDVDDNSVDKKAFYRIHKDIQFYSKHLSE